MNEYTIRSYNMFQSILSNLAIILFGHLLMTSLISYRKHIPRRLLQILIVLLYSGTIVTMFYLPIQFGEYRLDLRLIPLIFLALFRGWKVTIPTDRKSTRLNSSHVAISYA